MLPNKERLSFEALYPLIRESMDHGDSFRFTAFGNSMHPFIKGGIDRVCLSPVREDVKKYDIIFYRRDNGMFVLHRVIGIENGAFILCGDNQYSVEEGILPRQILAILTEIERNGKIVPLSSLSHKIWCHSLFMRRFWLHVKSYISRKFK